MDTQKNYLDSNGLEVLVDNVKNLVNNSIQNTMDTSDLSDEDFDNILSGTATPESIPHTIYADNLINGSLLDTANEDGLTVEEYIDAFCNQIVSSNNSVYCNKFTYTGELFEYDNQTYFLYEIKEDTDPAPLYALLSTSYNTQDLYSMTMQYNKNELIKDPNTGLHRVFSYLLNPDKETVYVDNTIEVSNDTIIYLYQIADF